MNEIATVEAKAAALHSTFHVERDYPQSPARVFRAFADKDMVRRWRVEDEGCEVHEFTFDFRVGGHEVSRFSFGGGPEIRLDAEFHDIVPGQRIVFAYRMVMGVSTFSASLTTIELTPSGTGTRLDLYRTGRDARRYRFRRRPRRGLPPSAGETRRRTRSPGLTSLRLACPGDRIPCRNREVPAPDYHWRATSEGGSTTRFDRWAPAIIG